MLADRWKPLSQLLTSEGMTKTRPLYMSHFLTNSNMTKIPTNKYTLNIKTTQVHYVNHLISGQTPDFGQKKVVCFC